MVSAVRVIGEEDADRHDERSSLFDPRLRCRTDKAASLS
jgi:hypothetical protein